SRAQARGGLAAAAAFLERASLLSPGPARPARRLLGRARGKRAPRAPDAAPGARRLLPAARAKRAAGALDAALGLLVTLEAGPLDALSAAEVEHLRGLIALVQRGPREAARLLVRAARRLEPLEAGLSRDTPQEPRWAPVWSG